MNANVRLQVKRDTTANWNNARGFIPLEGEIIVYTDYKIQNGKKIPAIKIGDGRAYVQDLPFQGNVTDEDISFWNDKVNIDDSGEMNGYLEGNTLVFSRSYVSNK